MRRTSRLLVAVALLPGLLIGCQDDVPVDTPELAAERQELVFSQMARVSTAQDLLVALGELPRHQLLPAAIRGRAYQDIPLMHPDGVQLWKPSSLAAAVEPLNPALGERVLAIGVQEGWLLAALARIGLDVHATDPQTGHLQRVRQTLSAAYGHEFYKPDAVTFHGSLEKVLAAGPFDVIFVRAAVERIPGPWLAALSPQGGRMGVLVGLPGKMRYAMVRREGNRFIEENLPVSESPYLFDDTVLNYAPVVSIGLQERNGVPR